MAKAVTRSGPGFHAAARQVDYAAAVALTKTAKLAQEAVTSALPQTFDRPVPFTRNAVAIKPARRSDLAAEVFVKDKQAEYLAIQETGGTRQPKPGSPINVPVGARLNQYGNLPRSFWAKFKALQAKRPYVGSRTYAIKSRRLVGSYGGGLFVADGKARTRHLAPGIYERTKVRRRKRGSRAKGGAGGLKLLVAFEERAGYRPRFNFQGRVFRTAEASLPELFVDELAKALATAR